MQYTAVIRTLGKAGEKYQTLLNSLINQTIKPSAIIVYIADGYPRPKETIGIEQYVYVKKGMVAQRALQYDEVNTEYILFLDDDVYLPTESVNLLYDLLIENNADVISPDVFSNANRPLIPRIMMTLSGRMRARKDDGIWAYKVMRNSGYSYNSHPTKNVYISQTNAGPCFFCSKKFFLSIHFEDELWLDNQQYALGDDQVMFYKMYKKNYKQLTAFNTGIIHLDAGSARKPGREKELIYSDFIFKTIFWHRFIYLPEHNPFLSFYDIACFFYMILSSFTISLFKFRFDIFKLKYSAVKTGLKFINSDSYKKIPLIK